MDILQNISTSHLAVWVTAGIVVGVLLQLIDQGKVRGGIFNTLVLSVIGGVLGGITAPIALAQTLDALSLENIAAAVIGAFILAILSRLLFRETGHIRTAH